MARLKTAQRGRVNIDEMMAHRKAYGERVGWVDYAKMVIFPGVGFAILSTAILYTPMVTLVFTIMGMLYGFFYLMPNLIAKEYENISFNQRNQFINNMTQIMTDENKTVSMALGTAKIRAKGEFKDELTRLEARLIGADTPGVQDAIDAMSGKYEHDPIFSQYIEQIETAALEGNSNIDTLKDIKGYHNQMKEKQDMYEQQKKGHLSDMKTMLFTMAAFIGALTFSFGFDTYVRAFAHALPGQIAGSLYLMLNLFFLKQFGSFVFDDSVTSTKS